MRIIDADTHVDETEDTWEYLQPDEQAYKPTTGYPPNPDPSRPPARYWLVDGRRHLRFIRDDAVTRTTVEKRELMDVPGRLADMEADRQIESLGLLVEGEEVGIARPLAGLAIALLQHADRAVVLRPA